MVRILVIDDNREVSELMRGLLEEAGYAVDLAADGALGLLLQRARPADVVITDIFMPNQDGIETVSRLRREFPNTKVIAMSGGGEYLKGRTHLATAAEIGAHVVLAKPFEGERLIETVREVLG